MSSDAIVVTSLGDASCNHASALSGINAAAYSRRRGVGVPLLVGLIFQVEALGTFLAGVILVGQLLAVFMATVWLYSQHTMTVGKCSNDDEMT